MQTTSVEIHSMSDEELIEGFQQSHSNDLFSELYIRYYEKVKLYCLKSLGNLSLAEDISQEVMLKVFERLANLRNPQLWVAWLFSIARNQVLNQHKGGSRWHLENEEIAYKIAEPVEDKESVVEKESRLQALPKLLENPEVRILRMKYIEGKSIEQLCHQMHMKESAVKMKLLRARQKVVKLYEEQRAWA